jgi:hypothetical protein
MGPTGCLGGPGPAGAGAAYQGTQGHTKVADQDRPSRLVGFIIMGDNHHLPLMDI